MSSSESQPKYLLSQNVLLLKKSGLLLSDYKTGKLKHQVLHFVTTIFVLTQYIELYEARSDVIQLLRNIKYSLMSIVNLSKIYSFILNQDKLKQIIDFVNEINIERCRSRDALSIEINNKLMKYCKLMTKFYLYLTLYTVAMVIVHPAVEYYIIFARNSDDNGNTDGDSQKYILIAPSWMPFNTDNLIVYLIQLVYQAYATIHTGLIMAAFDTCSISVMVFFRGELQLLRRDAQQLFGTVENPASKEEAKSLIMKCHKRCNDFKKYVKLFDSCLSPIMLLYVIVCSVMLCATAYQLRVETSAMQKFITAEYLTFGVSQLFMFCWHSNEVLYVSKDLKLGPYESLWWSRSVSEQKEISILTYQFNKEIAFSSGPFTSITVTTFISILKGAYSYYTLLSQSDN